MGDKMGAKITVQLDADLEARVKATADGAGVPLETVIEQAVRHALNDGDFEVDNSLPGDQPGVDNELPDRPSGGGDTGAIGPGDPEFNPNPDLNPDIDKDKPKR